MFLCGRRIASPVRRAAEWSHLESTVEALTAVSHRAVAKAESAENDVLKKYELQKSAFVKYALKLAETVSSSVCVLRCALDILACVYLLLSVCVRARVCVHVCVHACVRVCVSLESIPS